MIFRSKPLSEAKHLKVTLKTQNYQLKLEIREVKFLSPNSFAKGNWKMLLLTVPWGNISRERMEGHGYRFKPKSENMGSVQDLWCLEITNERLSSELEAWKKLNKDRYCQLGSEHKWKVKGRKPQTIIPNTNTQLTLRKNANSQ